MVILSLVGPADNPEVKVISSKPDIVKCDHKGAYRVMAVTGWAWSCCGKHVYSNTQ